MASFFDLDLRIGKVLKVEIFKEAKNPSYKLWIDFGKELGVKKSSAQITSLYSTEMLVHKLVVAVTNLPPKQVGPFMSEVLVLGVNGNKEGDIILLVPEMDVKVGSLVH